MHWPTSAITASSRCAPPIVLARRRAARATPAGARCRRGRARTGRTTRCGRTRRSACSSRGRSTRLVEHEHDARAERRLRLARGLERERQVELVGAQEAAGGAAHQDALQLACPPATPPASSSSSPQRRAERHLVDARALDVAREAEELRPGRDLGAGLGVDGAGARDDVEHVDERLDVVDDGRLAEEALRRPGTAACCAARRGCPRSSRRSPSPRRRCRRRAPLRISMSKREALAEHVVAEVAAAAAPPRSLPRARACGSRVLAADVDVAALAAGRVGGDRHRLDQRRTDRPRSGRGP